MRTPFFGGVLLVEVLMMPFDATSAASYAPPAGINSHQTLQHTVMADAPI